MTDLASLPKWVVCLIGLALFAAGGGIVWWVIPVPKLILMFRALGFVFGLILMGLGAGTIIDTFLGNPE